MRTTYAHGYPTGGALAKILAIEDDPSFRDLLGLHLQSAGHTLRGAAVGERSQYDKFDTAFQTERRDVRRAFEAGLHYYLERDLSLRLNLSYACVRSNIPIYEYNRFEAALMLRRDFR